MTLRGQHLDRELKFDRLGQQSEVNDGDSHRVISHLGADHRQSAGAVMASMVVASMMLWRRGRLVAKIFAATRPRILMELD